MRDCSTNRAGFDRVLMAVAATFLTVSATSALAQGNPARNSAAELAIDAAIPRPDPVNLPPVSINDFKPDTTAAAPGGATTVPAAAPAAATATPSVEPAAQPTKAASTVAPADQPVADKLRDMLGTKSLRYFDRKAERAAVEKFYNTRDFAPLWTQAGSLNDSGKGVVARLRDAASDGLNAADYPVPDFSAATTPDALAEADLKLTASMLDYARQAQSGRMHWSQVSGDIQYPEHPTDAAEVLTNVTTAKDASAALDGYNPPQKLYRALKKKLAELRGEGDGSVAQIADGPVLKYTPPRARNQAAIEVEDDR